MIRRAIDAVRFLARSYKRYRDEDTILVYQMGKVGSTALTRALGDRAIQIANFYAENAPCPHRPYYRAMSSRRLLHALFFQVIRLAVRRRRTLRIVTLVRDPVGRNVSMYFQELHYWLAHYFSELRPDRVSREDPDTLLDCYRESFDHRYPLEWFDRELKRVTGVDVYEHAFDTATGWGHVAVGGTRVLIVQSDRLGDCWQAIQDFCGLGLTYREDNRAERKWYAPVYADFLKRFTLSAEELEAMYSSRYATFFFSAQQLAEFRNRWRGRAAGA